MEALIARYSARRSVFGRSWLIKDWRTGEVTRVPSFEDAQAMMEAWEAEDREAAARA